MPNKNQEAAVITTEIKWAFLVIFGIQAKRLKTMKDRWTIDNNTSRNCSINKDN
jgi:hypothetical protein